MLSGLSVFVIAIVILALIFDFINGFHDTANSIATTVATRVLPARIAILMAACLNFVGALVSTNVAKTISSGLVSGAVPEYLIMIAIIGAIIWNLITWYLGIPSSSSHALIGSLIGTVIVYSFSFKQVIWSGVLFKVILPFLASPIIGFIVGFLVMRFLFWALSRLSQYIVNKWFSKLQILSAAFMAYSHGNNDAQKSMGIITFALINAEILATNAGIPLWVKVACAIAMFLGTSVGGWRIIKTMGNKMIKLQPINGFAAETAAAVVIQAASAIGAPVSTTHIISSSIMGVGAAKRRSAVNWSLAKSLVYAWVVTLPVTAVIGGTITLVVKLFM